MMIVLTADEIHLGSSHALLRRVEKHRNNHKPREPMVKGAKTTWDNEINGALAELAWCKLRGIYWTGVSNIRAKDGGSVEIRWTHHEGKGGLPIYTNDDDSAVFVLVDGYPPRFNFVGWMYGSDAKVNAEDVCGMRIVSRHKLNIFPGDP